VRRKDGQELSFRLLVVDDPMHAALGRELARQWAGLGVRGAVEPIAPGTSFERLADRDFQAIVVEMESPGDPDPYPFWDEAQVTSGQNYAGYRDREMSQTLEKARVTENFEERAALYSKFQRRFASQVPAIMLYYPIYTYAVDSHVGGVQIGPLTHPGDRFQSIADWYVVRRRVSASR
jgi:peptide/nickel transport system substrate-binding protein